MFIVIAIETAARPAGSFGRILESSGQSPEHRVHPPIPETRYLRAFFCRLAREVG